MVLSWHSPSLLPGLCLGLAVTIIGDPEVRDTFQAPSVQTPAPPNSSFGCSSPPTLTLLLLSAEGHFLWGVGSGPQDMDKAAPCAPHGARPSLAHRGRSGVPPDRGWPRLSGLRVRTQATASETTPLLIRNPCGLWEFPLGCERRGKAEWGREGSGRWKGRGSRRPEALKDRGDGPRAGSRPTPGLGHSPGAGSDLPASEEGVSAALSRPLVQEPHLEAAAAVAGPRLASSPTLIGWAVGRSILTLGVGLGRGVVQVALGVKGSAGGGGKGGGQGEDERLIKGKQVLQARKHLVSACL